MLVIQVSIHVKPEHLEAFKAATLDNARNSLREPGVGRFDVVQRKDDPTRFMLIEAYRDADAPARHRETPHYKTWLKTVTDMDMLVEPRTRVEYASLFPSDTGWDMPAGYAAEPAAPTEAL
jgi:quinol monooxygenase YgiN